MNKWIQSTGGPLILIGRNDLKFWDGSRESKGYRSDYERACEIQEYLKWSKIRNFMVFVFGDEPHPMTWKSFPSRPGGVFIRWITCDSEKRSQELIGGIESPRGGEEWMECSITDEPSIIWDSAFPGTYKNDYLEVALAPGKYRIYTEQFKPDPNSGFLLHFFEKCG